MFVKRLHTDADVVHGDTCANLWVIYASVGIGGYHLLHLTWVGRSGCSISELLTLLGPGTLLCILIMGDPPGIWRRGRTPTWDLEEGSGAPMWNLEPLPGSWGGGEERLTGKVTVKAFLLL